MIADVQSHFNQEDLKFLLQFWPSCYIFPTTNVMSSVQYNCLNIMCNRIPAKKTSIFQPHPIRLFISPPKNLMRILCN